MLLGLTLCVCVGYFGASGLFIGWLAALLKGVFGYGYWLVAPAMLLAGLILLFHRGRPVILRTVCALLLPLLWGSLGHVLFCKETFDSSLGILVKLWTSGNQLASGGAVSGGVAIGLMAVFGKVVSIVLLIALLALLAAVALWPVGKVLAEQLRSRPQYEEQPRVRPAHQEIPPETPREAPRRRTEAAQIDFPLDGEQPSAPEEPRQGRFTSFFRHKDEGQKTPDQVLRSREPTPAIPAESPAEEPTAPVPAAEAPKTAPVPQTAPLPIREEPAPRKEKTAGEVAAQTAAVTAEIEEKLAGEETTYQFPPITLLKMSRGENHVEAGAELRNHIG